tara:strand:- start:1315 stop:1587 length:273 start_codon:yes stop_codon:yes gene_type:complete
MEFNIQGFIDVFTWQVSWLDANFFWVLLSFLIYVFLVLCLISIVATKSNEPKPSKEETKASMKRTLKVMLFAIIALAIIKISEFFIILFE